jgi:hypothetical protein
MTPDPKYDPNKMRVELAAKLLVIAWTLMKKKEKFDPTYLNVG